MTPDREILHCRAAWVNKIDQFAAKGDRGAKPWQSAGMTDALPQILILAAGASSRMRGADKLLEPVAGRPLLAHVLAEAQASGLPLLVVLPPDRPARTALVKAAGLPHVIAARAAEGMAESLKAGVAALPSDKAIMLLLADLPEITAEDLRQMARVHAEDRQAILRGTAQDGRPGHPVLFPADLRAELLALNGDEGARSLLARHRDRLRPVPLPSAHATTDLDTPEDWAEWRASRA